MRCNNYSIPRSKEIMRIFKDMEWVEQLGSGIPSVLQTYGRECFKFSDNYVRMSFPIEVSDESINVGVNDLLQIIMDNPGINAKQLHTYFDVTDRTVERWLKQLREEGKIEFRGAPKIGGYYVVEK